MKLSEQTLSLYVAALIASTTTTTTAFTTNTPSINHHQQLVQRRQQHNDAITSSRQQRPTPKSTTSTSPLFGIMDEVNSGAFDLNELVRNAGGTPNVVDKDLTQAFEILLAELVFSANDPVMDIIDKFDRCSDQRFLDWLDNKVENCTDVEEKMALRDLYGIILDVIEKNELAIAAAEREEREKAEAKAALEAEVLAQKNDIPLSDAAVLQKATQISKAETDAELKEQEEIKAKEAKSFFETELTPEIRSTYEKLVKKLLPPYRAGDTVETVTVKNYEKFDAQLMKVLNERAENGDADSAAVLEALAVEQARRMTVATELLKEILSLGEPLRMEGAIVKMVREEKVDETLLLLLEANAVQAEAAGAAQPAALMRKLKKRAENEKDKKMSSKEIKLLRQLLREEDAEERERLLVDAFTPKEALIVPGTMENAARAADGETPEEEKPMPEVPPPDFINACKAVLLNFGNISDGSKKDMSAMVKKIAGEAEVVATRIYGAGMTVREQQDRAWKDQTRSIFDLETLEIEAERMGTKAPWAAGKDINDEILPGFGADGVMKVGGG